MMMDRDKRLTGHKRGQQVRISAMNFHFQQLNMLSFVQAEPYAPDDFETNSVWYTERTS